MDDLTILDIDKEKLERLITPITEWLRKNRHQELHPAKTTLKSLQQDSIELLGYRFIAPTGELVRQARNSKQWEFIAMLRGQKEGSFPFPEYPHELSLEPSRKETGRMLGKINSRLGLMKHARSFEFRKKTLQKFLEDVNPRLEFLGDGNLRARKNFSSLKQHCLRLKKRRKDSPTLRP